MKRFLWKLRYALYMRATREVSWSFAWFNAGVDSTWCMDKEPEKAARRELALWSENVVR